VLITGRGILLLVLSQAAPSIGLSQAQSVDADPQPADTNSAKKSKLPFDISGFLAFRSLADDDLDLHRFFREYSGSIFISKAIGPWVFHSEINADTSADFDSEGIHLFRPRRSLSGKIDNATVNYNRRDWLQFQAGFLFIPTYWRTHRFQSTTLTVDEPLMDQNVFPTSFAGIAIHGDKYFESGGISYQFYGGSAKQEELDHETRLLVIERNRALGGKLVVHVPSRRVFNTLDIGYHLLEQIDSQGGCDHTYGWEVNVETHRTAVLAEYAHAGHHDASGAQEYFRQGYYFQPSYRITPRLFVVARYDWLNRDSRFADESGLARQSAGVTFRPTPDISLKIEADRYQPVRGRLPGYYGVSAAVVYFFHRP
jgi:hypothetical protein